ncbi:MULTISPECIES: hypothetical protein [unclassified Rhizobium]|uniref:hypothetical protein n=1 Tax=unclassified Rhizobium TaxID=2613769 RepID=UPI0013C47E5A|nr:MULTISPECIES: hypothetical protein [unclassified Rhizobium]
MASVLAAVFAGGGDLMTFIHGASLSLAVAGSILLFKQLDPPNAPPTTGIVLLSVPTVVAIWSLAAGLVVAAQAQYLSGGRPFCIAIHGDEKPIASFAALRGLFFYTNRSGYKDADRWYFHSLLLVGNDKNMRAYNWSPRHMRFDYLADPDRMLVGLQSACVPKIAFLRYLSLF